MTDQTKQSSDLQAIAEEAYIFLYPLVLMDITRKVMTNVVEPKGIDGPLDTFASFKTYPPLDFTEVVRPNFDTLYTCVWMDLTEEPRILSLPDAKGRYYLAPTLSMWTDVIASPGWRTTGTGAGDYAYVPPGWAGTLPDGVVRVECSSRYLWMIGRTAASGPDDYDAVHEFQAGMKLTPLSQWGKDWKASAGTVDPSIDTKTAPLQQVADMSAKDFFAYGADLMKLHPPKNTDYSQVWRLARIGLIPGEDFTMTGLTDDQLESARKSGYSKIKAHSYQLGTEKDGWNLLLGTLGSYGIEYLQRASVALFGLGCNQLADAYYPVLADNIGPTTETYVLHFDKGQTPPAGNLWSITLYDDKGFTVPNSLNRGNLASHMDLNVNADGSTDLYIGANSPGKDKEPNWLPAPSDKAWNLTMRLYPPEQDAIDGTWTPPPLKKMN
jgi:hypothetical protein